MAFAAEKVVRGNMDLPPGARFTGEFHGNLPVMEEDVPIYEEQQVKDAAGELVYRLNRQGHRIGVVTERVIVGHETRKFVNDDLGNGIVVKNYYYQPDPETEARQAAAAELAPERVAERLAAMEARQTALLEKMGLTERDAAALLQPDAPKGKGK